MGLVRGIVHDNYTHWVQFWHNHIMPFLKNVTFHSLVVISCSLYCYQSMIVHIANTERATGIDTEQSMRRALHTKPSISVVVNWFLKNATDTKLLNPMLK
jgi:hypothetical protein